MSRGGFQLEFESDIARAPRDVFDLIADPSSFKRVDPAMVDYGPPGPLAAGSTGWFRHRRGVMTEFDPPHRLVVEIAGMGYAMTESATLDSTVGGTHARFVDRVWPTSLPGRMLVALSGGIMRRDLQARAGRLREILEAGRD